MRSPLGKTRNFKTVACSTYSLQIARTFRIRFNFLTDTAHIDIDRAGSYKARVAPDGIKQMIPAEDTARVPGKIIEEPEFGSGGGSQLPPHLELHGAGIDYYFLKADDRGSGGAFETAQHSLYPSHQFPGGEGLGYVVVGSKFKPQNAVVFARLGSQKDNGHDAEREMIAQPAAHIQAIPARNHDVEEEERGDIPFRVRNKVGGSREEAHFEAGSL